MPGRWLVVLLLFGFVLQPVMATYGQLHETLAHMGSDRSHVEDDAHVEMAATRTAESPGEDSREDLGVFHALSHHAHCCAQPQSLPPSSLPALPPALAGTCPPSVDPDASPDSRFETPFRPPIVA
ncbi:MAG: hypothetical protein JNM58_06940 [Xanthomonadaceae bacterium]|nr:hypothetical protein [Xanthomonadaceae bacterium]